MDAMDATVLMFVLMKPVIAASLQKTSIQAMTANKSDKKIKQCTKCEYILSPKDVEINLCPMCGYEVVSEVWR